MKKSMHTIVYTKHTHYLHTQNITPRTTNLSSVHFQRQTIPLSLVSLPTLSDLASAVSSHVISQLKVVTRMGDVEGKFDRETWAAELSPILTLWKRLNQVSPLILFILDCPPLHIPHTITVLLLHAHPP